MPEWLVERGIGETRAALVEHGEIVEARIVPDDVVPAGTVLDARLKQVGQPAIAVSDGREYLLPKGAPGVTEGGLLAIEVTREWIGGAEPWKRPMARVADGPPRSAPGLRGRLLPFPSPDDALRDAGWDDLLEEARSGIVQFPGGTLRVSLTPAMTLIDVDGTLPAAELTIAGARAAARAIRRHGIGGSIGVDLPAGKSKDARVAAAAAVDAVLPQPFERTAVNGFGFLQIVRRRPHASLFELAEQRTSFEARSLLRRAARWTGPATVVAHPTLVTFLERQPSWIEALRTQVGGEVSLHADPRTPIFAGYVEPA